MPNLGPFGEALGRAISPALNAAKKSAIKFGEERVFPTVGRAVERATGGTKEFIPPILHPEERMRIDTQRKSELSKWQEERDYNTRRLDETENSLVEDPSDWELNHQKRSLESEIDDIDGEMELVKKKYPESSKPRIADVPFNIMSDPLWNEGAAREFDPKDPLTLGAVAGRVLDPRNSAEVQKNLDILFNLARTVKKVAPKPMLDALPPAPRGLLQLLAGNGEVTDLGVSEASLKSSPWLARELSKKSIINRAYLTSAANHNGFLNAAINFGTHDAVSHINIDELRPVMTRGIFGNSLSRAYLYQRFDGGWDLVDEYRFFDHVTSEVQPYTKQEALGISRESVRNYHNAAGIGKLYVTKLIGETLTPAAEALTKYLAEKHPQIYRNKFADKLLQLKNALIEMSGKSPENSEINFHIDKWFVGAGTPYPVVIKDIDRLLAQAHARMNPSSKFDYYLNHFREDFARWKTLGESEVEPGTMVERVEEKEKKFTNFGDWHPQNISPMEAAAWEYIIRDFKGQPHFLTELQRLAGRDYELDRNMSLTDVFSLLNEGARYKVLKRTFNEPLNPAMKRKDVIEAILKKEGLDIPTAAPPLSMEALVNKYSNSYKKLYQENFTPGRDISPLERVTLYEYRDTYGIKEGKSITQKDLARFFNSRPVAVKETWIRAAGTAAPIVNNWSSEASWDKNIKTALTIEKPPSNGHNTASAFIYSKEAMLDKFPDGNFLSSAEHMLIDNLFKLGFNKGIEGLDNVRDILRAVAGGFHASEADKASMGTTGYTEEMLADAIHDTLARIAMNRSGIDNIHVPKHVAQSILDLIHWNDISPNEEGKYSLGRIDHANRPVTGLSLVGSSPGYSSKVATKEGIHNPEKFRNLSLPTILKETVDYYYAEYKAALTAKKYNEDLY